jgi:hypothetical protein
MEECGAHPGAATERTLPPRDGSERTWQPNSGRRVQRTQRQPAGEERCDVPGRPTGPEWSDLGGDCHLYIVPVLGLPTLAMSDGPQGRT